MGEETRLFRDDAGRLVAETRFRVRYFETDAMGIVHHTAYITWFEEARSAFTRAIGYPYARMESEGLLLAVAEVRARYHSPARCNIRMRRHNGKLLGDCHRRRLKLSVEKEWN